MSDSASIDNEKPKIVHKKKVKKSFTLLDSNSGRVPSGNITYFAAFLLPLIMMVALYYTKKIYPWGDNCYLRSDMYHQYAPFFSELWHKIRSGESLTYSWDIGMGINFTSLYAYYLASPTNWLIALFPQKNMIEIMNSIIILKIAASSLSITYYLTKHFKTKSCLTVIFGVFYALSGYIAAYSWNIMWLDCIVLFPLIMLGLERLVNENRCLFYAITLGLCIFTNYYIAIMVCMAVVLYYVVLMIAYDGPKSIGAYIRKFVNFCIYSLLAGGIGACLLLPELYTFSLSASSDSKFPEKWESYFSVLSMLTRHLMDIPIHLGLEHLPNIYCGVAAFLLVPLYVLNKKVNSREKIGKMVLLLIFLTGYNLNITNYIWHGLHFPNSLPARQSFMYIFFIIVIGFEAVYRLKDADKKDLMVAFWVALGTLLVLEQFFRTEPNYEMKSFYLSGLFILIYSLLIYISRNVNLKTPIVLFLAFSTIIVEATMNMDSTGIGTTTRSAYLLDYDAVETVTDTVAKDDDSFYRMDKIFGARSRNDGAWHNYRSISTFSSTCSAGMSDFFKHIGLKSSTNAYGADGLTAVTCSLLSVKYQISNRILNDSPMRYFYTGSDGEFIYKNNYTLPIGYAIEQSGVSGARFTDTLDGIAYQNQLIKAFTGVTDVFVKTEEFPTQEDFFITPVVDSHVYMVTKSTAIDYLNVNINDRILSYTDLSGHSNIIDIGYVKATDNIEVTGQSMMNATIYYLDENKFIEAFNKLNKESFQIDKHSTTEFSGTITVSEDKPMLFTIPYDAGWTVKVDGKEVDVYDWNKSLMYINLSKGSHKIELSYTPVDLYKGIFITILTVLILIGIAIGRRLIQNRKLNLKKLPTFLRIYLNDPTVFEDSSEACDIIDEAIIQKEIDEMDDFDNLDSIEDDFIDSSEDTTDTETVTDAEEITTTDNDNN